MERRDDIRAAMQNLLARAKRPDVAQPFADPLPPAPEILPQPLSMPEAGELAVSGSHLAVLREIQGTLRQSGIVADVPEIIQAMVDALASRPSLCRGLVAAYLLEDP